MVENLEEIKKSLIQQDFDLKRHQIIDNLRREIFNLVCQEIHFQTGTLDENSVQTKINEMVSEIQNTNWKSAVNTSTLNQLMQNSLMFIIADKIDKCEHCNKQYLSIHLNFCDPIGEGIHKYYCKSCITLRHIEHHQALANKIIPCHACETSYTQQKFWEDKKKFDAEFRNAPSIPPTYEDYCYTCLVKRRKKYERVCCICNGNFIAYNPSEKIEVCQKCRTPQLVQEAQRVDHHNTRAKGKGLICNLTLRQWLNALTYFDWKCAYCSRPFKGLEHYVPLGLNGSGTTANNCVPSCNRCNNRKSDKHPDDFERLFPTDNITRIKAYFASLDQTA